MRMSNIDSFAAAKGAHHYRLLGTRELVLVLD
jgi:hypothetical protein